MSHEVLTVGTAPGLKAKMEMKDVAAGSKVQISYRMKKKIYSFKIYSYNVTLTKTSLLYLTAP